MYAQGLKPAYIGFGVSKSHVNGSGLDIGDELGFNIQAGTMAEINAHSGIVGELQFIKHSNKYEDGNDKVKTTLQSLNLALYYKVYPVGHLFFGSGMQVGFFMRPRINHQKAEPDTSGHIGVLGMVGYDLNRYSIVLRGARYLSDSRIFDSTIQIGVNYSFPAK